VFTERGSLADWLCDTKKKIRCNAFPRSIDKLQGVNELPTNKGHVKVPQGFDAPKNLVTKNIGF